MQKRLTDGKRAALESRFKRLKQVQALFDEGKAANAVDKVSPDNADIQGVVEALMRIMQAEPGVGYKASEPATKKSATRKKLETLVRRAFDESASDSEEAPAPKPPKESPEEPPMDDAPDMQNPMMQPMQALEQEVQTMDDAHLTQEVEQLEDDLKDKMFSNPGDAMSAPGPEGAPAPPMGDMSMPKPPMNKAPMAPGMPPPGPELSPEHKMALLMSLPKAKRVEKAASLRALANALEMREHEVSQNNNMNGNPSDALGDDYKDEEEGSMKDTGTRQAALKLKATLRELITASEAVEDSIDSSEEPEKDVEKTAVLKLALRHLLASVEDMEEKKDEDKLEKEAGEMPPWLKDEEKSEDEEDEKPEEDENPEKEKHEASLDEKRAILRARLATLRNSKTASVDGKTMKTPKEVPSPSGTTEDQLKGDAKIQYAPALGSDGLEEIHEHRQKIPTDKQVAGNDEPNELYFKNSPSGPGPDRMTSEKDSSPKVNNKRVLKDEGKAVYSAQPTSPTEHMEMGEGSHQHPEDWEHAKERANMTPTKQKDKDRLVGLSELIQTRTERAMKLASKMADAGQIKTAAQLQEQVIKLASLEDDVFDKVAEVFALTTPLTKKAEMPEQFKAHEGDPDDKKPPFAEKDEDEDEDEADENPFARKAAARRIRRQATKEEDDYGTSVRTAQTSRGINKALNLMSDASSNSDLRSKLNGMGWQDAVTEASKKADLDKIWNGS